MIRNSENSLAQKLNKINQDQGPENLIVVSSFQELEKDAYKIYNIPIFKRNTLIDPFHKIY